MNAHAEEVERWRAARLARLTGPDGWLTVVGLHWLEPGDNPVGSDQSNAVTLPASAPDRAGTVVLDGDTAVFEPHPGVEVVRAGRVVREPVRLLDDLDQEPTVLELGTLRFHLIRRYGRLAVRVRDLDSPGRRVFRGIQHYPVQERWRFDAAFEPYDPAPTYPVPTVLDMDETYLTPGAVAFEHDGGTHRLDAFLEPGETDLFIVFGDLTNGTETYGGGRYLYTRPPDEHGVVSLDFNRAYNPPCVFTAHATCPIPLPQNRLPFRVEAGEKRYEAEATPPPP